MRPVTVTYQSIISDWLESDQIPKSVQASTEEISLSSPYTLATLVKLLMDCPEYIWRSLEQDDFLSAARLEGLARIIYREVVNASERQEDDAVMVCDIRSESLLRTEWQSSERFPADRKTLGDLVRPKFSNS